VTPRAHSASLSTRDLSRAARLLSLRSRREATGLFAGNYTSAFRGGGLEFEEARPYVPGDDVRTIDWNATARSPEPYVKRFREERNQTLLFALDVSGSMGFGSQEQAKAVTAAHALALMAAAAGRAGDRIGLVAFDQSVRARVGIGRGGAHSLHVIRSAVEVAGTSRAGTRLAVGLRALRSMTRRRAVVVVLSDFRDPDGLAHAFGDLSSRHDVVAAVIADPREEELPPAGLLRLADAEAPGRTWLLRSGSKRTRERYRKACLERRRRIERELRYAGVDPVWLRTDRSPLFALGRFFRERAARRTRGTS
jgi:uncharacterized protein (DUF58 family)